MKLNKNSSILSKEDVAKHFDRIAEKFESYRKKNGYYYSQIVKFYQSIIPAGSRVLDIGCATGGFLGSLKPSYGVGIDLSQKMIEIARKKHPNLSFFVQDADKINLKEKFDYIVISNLLDFLPDIWLTFANLKKNCHNDTKIIITSLNPLWEPILKLGAFLHLRTPDIQRNFITNNDLINILDLLNYRITEKGYRLFMPKYIPLISAILNRVLPRLPVINNFCALQYVVADNNRSIAQAQNLSCSIIIPCHNEEDNIDSCVKRIPQIGKFTEIVIIDDGSTDNTAKRVRKIMETDKRVKLISYLPNKGKGYAVRMGFDNSLGDVLIILDADMAVEPEVLDRFFSPIAEGKADFVNGTRMVYPMDKDAMRILNFFGNKVFGILLSLIMGQRNTDTLCGTKAFLRRDYRNMRMGKCPWGDFDLLFEASRLKLKMVEMPILYKSRTAGKSKMKAFKHGIQLLKMCWRGLNEIP